MLKISELKEKLKEDMNSIGEKCVISHLSIDENKDVLLPCKHWYKYNLFIKYFKNHSQCYYCYNIFQLNDLLHKCKKDNCSKLTYANSRFCNRHLFSNVKCNHILLTGKNKGKECNKKCCKNSNYCFLHIKKYGLK